MPKYADFTLFLSVRDKIRDKFLFEFIPVARERLVNILDQKKTSRAFALISAEAVKGILVV